VRRATTRALIRRCGTSHLWINANQSTDRSESIVAEVTPRLRAKHPKWTATAFNRLAQKHTRVRISGWLMLDQEHPEQLGETRATLWEIHPIMQIEIDKAGPAVGEAGGRAAPPYERQPARGSPRGGRSAELLHSAYSTLRCLGGS
jgi:hypothetical protein